MVFSYVSMAGVDFSFREGPSIWCLRPMWVPTLMEPQRVSWDERQPCRESVFFAFWDNPTPKERRQNHFLSTSFARSYIVFIVCWCVGVGVFFFFSMDFFFFVDGSCWGDQRCCFGTFHLACCIVRLLAARNCSGHLSVDGCKVAIRDETWCTTCTYI